ncbi:MAG: GDP-mannose 4,6-dehydratase [Aigarchaeota archaeon]|nr:GDP-mannose 4,6-dehydratase [Candidatus Pelearchaeum maunauluense]
MDGKFRPAERDFTYISDAVDGTIRVGEKGRGLEIFNLGFGRPVSILRVAELMMEKLGGRVEIERGELKPHESLISYSDNTKAMKVLGWHPKVDLEEMVERYAKWFISEFKTRE